MIRIENRRAFSTEGLKIRRKGEDSVGYSSLSPVDGAEGLEEVTPEMAEASARAAAEREAAAAYGARVDALIRERYPLRDELAVMRQRDSKPAEFAAYDAYAEECKARAKEELDGRREAGL